mmetsp:Transcript_48185/g.104358  ORF Transcript_48185/g.104358 Transcript_48185/m.104358 type:complete len:264 (+) Transcript_48185:1798-2589(+)
MVAIPASMPAAMPAAIPALKMSSIPVRLMRIEVCKALPASHRMCRWSLARLQLRSQMGPKQRQMRISAQTLRAQWRVALGSTLGTSLGRRARGDLHTCVRTRRLLRSCKRRRRRSERSLWIGLKMKRRGRRLLQRRARQMRHRCKTPMRRSRRTQRLCLARWTAQTDLRCPQRQQILTALSVRVQSLLRPLWKKVPVAMRRVFWKLMRQRSITARHLNMLLRLHGMTSLLKVPSRAARTCLKMRQVCIQIVCTHSWPRLRMLL